jgi:hypothetical protein
MQLINDRAHTEAVSHCVYKALHKALRKHKDTPGRQDVLMSAITRNLLRRHRGADTFDKMQHSRDGEKAALSPHISVPYHLWISLKEFWTPLNAIIIKWSPLFHCQSWNDRDTSFATCGY